MTKLTPAHSRSYNSYPRRSMLRDTKSVHIIKNPPNLSRDSDAWFHATVKEYADLICRRGSDGFTIPKAVELLYQETPLLKTQPSEFLKRKNNHYNSITSVSEIKEYIHRCIETEVGQNHIDNLDNSDFNDTLRASLKAIETFGNDGKKWANCFKLLVAYKKQHNHTNVNGVKPVSLLANWVVHCRHNRDSLSDDKTALLKAIGFDFKPAVCKKTGNSTGHIPQYNSDSSFDEDADPPSKKRRL